MIEPSEGLTLNPAQGGIIQNTGCGDREFRVLDTPENKTSPFLLDANIDVSGISQVCIQVTYTKGSTISFNLQPVWRVDSVNYPGGFVINSASPIFVVSSYAYKWTADFQGYVTFINPGFQILDFNYFYTLGLFAGHSIKLTYLRGWGKTRQLFK